MNLANKSEQAIKKQVDERKKKKPEEMTRPEEMAVILEDIEAREKKKKKPKRYEGKEFYDRMKENEAVTEKFLNRK